MASLDGVHVSEIYLTVGGVLKDVLAESLPDFYDLIVLTMGYSISWALPYIAN